MGPTMNLRDRLEPSAGGFAKDPFGYSALGWHKWGIAQTVAGFRVDLAKGPSAEDLKSPVLWLSHTQALTAAAIVLIKGKPDLDPLPKDIRGIAHCQYHAVALMLVGYSLESCLKAMLIMAKGIPAYTAEEKKHYHHDLEKLAEFVPALTLKDKAVLKGLTHFIKWAGRYPDPGFGRDDHAQEIFTISETYKISAKDLFDVAAKVTSHSREVIADYAGKGS